jgi:hypothetical protein
MQYVSAAQWNFVSLLLVYLVLRCLQKLCELKVSACRQELNLLTWHSESYISKCTTLVGLSLSVSLSLFVSLSLSLSLSDWWKVSFILSHSVWTDSTTTLPCQIKRRSFQFYSWWAQFESGLVQLTSWLQCVLPSLCLSRGVSVPQDSPRLLSSKSVPVHFIDGTTIGWRIVWHQLLVVSLLTSNV